jgi:hypothetical protein|tara:strand:- start:1090 stop:1419 length:330 start_codon:yes stop_codon:yes gene_type:complete
MFPPTPRRYPPAPRRHIRFKGTRSLKEAAQAQLAKFRDKIQKQGKTDSSFWNPRVKNLMEDIDELSWDVDDLSEADIWPSDFTERFKNIYETTKRLGIDISLMDTFTTV